MIPGAASEHFLGLPYDRWSAVGDAATAGTFAVAVLAAVVAGVQLRLTRQVRLDQTRPYVMASFEPGITWFNSVDLLVQNIGAGPAHDVKITVDPPLARADDSDPKLTTARYFNERVPLMPPRYELRTYFDSMTERHGKDLPERFTFILTYHDGHGHEFEESIVQDLGIMNDLLFTEVYGVHHAAKALRDLTKAVEKMPFTKNKPLDVTVEDRRVRSERVRTEQAQRRAHLEELARKRQEAVQRPPENSTVDGE